MKKKVLFITTAFPFYPGEQFIEDEINYLDSSLLDFTVVPMSANGEPRAVRKEIKIEKYLAENINSINQLIYTFKAFFSKTFWLELGQLHRQKNLKIGCALRAIKATALTLLVEKKLRSLIKRGVNVDVIYTYWNDVACYASIILKNKGLVKKVISRAHGYDLYSERRAYNYMPLKNQFIKDLDFIFFISQQGLDYYKNKYQIPHERLKLSRLGVVLEDSKDLKTKKTENFHVLSVSSCVEVKRVHKIAEALSLIASSSEKKVRWSHIGDGPLLSELKKYSEKILNPEFIEFRFFGNLQREEVLNFYKNQSIDVFINVSESEGIPVSIMEAMSYGIPVVATDVGGVSELVDPSCGVLIEKDFQPHELLRALQQVGSLDHLKLHARAKIENQFSAERNYKKFNSMIAEL
jgi:colanic acid/amylovoran biosynthesis glycosyltransferase